VIRRARTRYGAHRSQFADLYLPRGAGPYPVAVLIHGGFWRKRYGSWLQRRVARNLRRHGWAVWNIEYRRLGDGGGWPETFDDVGAAIDALADKADPRLDLDRITVIGHSAGGQLAIWAAARPHLAA